jgi:uncharacterized protein DUF1707
MSIGALDPLIHDPERLRIIATLAALPDGELDHAGYVRTGKTGDNRAQTTVALTGDGRAALDRYTAVLRQLPQLATDDHQAPAPHERVGDVDRETAAAALGEHFVQGRLTLDELNARLDATLTARTHGELSQAACDLPYLGTRSAPVSLPQGKRARSGRKGARSDERAAPTRWRIPGSGL